MSCRSVPGMSVPMGLANIESGLDDDQVQSLVHQLRHEYSSAQGDDNSVVERIAAEEAWANARQSLATQIEAHPTLRPQRRAGMLQRIRGAATTPPPDMVYAATQIRSRCVRVARLLEDQLAIEAARAGGFVNVGWPHHVRFGWLHPWARLV